MDKELLKIIDGCKKQDANAQRKLFDRFAPLVMGVCMRYFQNEMAASDVLQDSFIKVFEKIEMYEVGGSFEGWLKRLTVNTCLDQLRKDKKSQLEVQVEEANLDSVYPEILDELAAEEIIKVVQALPDGYRIVFNMYAVEGYSHKEIADALDITVNTSKSQYSRAKAMLRDRLMKMNNSIP